MLMSGRLRFVRLPALVALILPAVGAGPAQRVPVDGVPAKAASIEVVRRSQAEAEKAFIRGDLFAERAFRRQIVAAVVNLAAADHPDVVRERALLASVERSLALGPEDREKIAAARRRAAAGLAALKFSDPAAAVEHFTAARETHERLLGSQDAQVASLELQIGNALIGSGQHPAALEAMQSAAEAYRASIGAANAAYVYCDLVPAYVAASRLEDAENAAVKAAADAAEGWGEGSPVQAVLLFHLSTVYKAQGESASAVGALVLAEEYFGKYRPSYAGWAVRCRLEKAGALADFGRLAESLPLFQSGLTEAETLPEDDIARLSHSLARYRDDYSAAAARSGNAAEIERAKCTSQSLRDRPTATK